MSMGVRSGQSWGPCFPARCPMCAQDTTFNLLVQFNLDETTIIGVICEKCDYEVLTDSPEEREKLSQAAQLWRQHEDGNLDAADLVSALEQLDSTTLARIISEARAWKCPKCEHQNPLHFVTCWHCSYERPLTAEERSLEQVEHSDGDEEDPDV